ncbi:cytochrome P450 [Crepidotus variabilis]|uniref:Cytochrome P450 n=1 Tax=Crepidotus variabilis TaxID=179855 RepID=A0A9P6E4V8_9AGAR|nr:cytochrome P450 [Crepidotus variabilis]
MATCRELATDMKAMSKLREQYWLLEKNATPTALLLQLLPSSEERKKLIASRDLHATMRTYVENRKGATPNSDAIDFLLSKGLKTHEAVEFAVNMTFLGLINTGCTCCTLLYLSFHTEWKQKVAADVNAIIEKHTNTSSPEPLYKRFAAVPISAWDEEMPALELVLRETLRLIPSPTALRRNFQENLEINGKCIPKEPYDYLGWGGGRHPCLDIKFARLEIKIIVALLLAGYGYDAVNERGGRPERLPGTDFNDIHQPRPVAGDPCYLKFKRAVD